MHLLRPGARPLRRAIDNMAPAVAVKWENLAELPAEDRKPSARPAAGGAARRIYYAGDKVMVERSTAPSRARRSSSTTR